VTSVVTLSDGRKVASDSEAWLWECLARHVLALPFEQRRPWIEDFADKHKSRPAAAETLRRTVTRVYQHSQKHSTSA
jgi:hypothetical protein